jgi:signal peptidase I
MTDAGRPYDFESPESAFDGELADRLAIDDIADQPEAGDQDPVAPSPPKSSAGPRHARRRSAAPEDNLREDRGAAPSHWAAADQASSPTSPIRPPEPEDKPAGRTGRGASHRYRPSKKGGKKAPWWELPALALFAILIAILVKTFIVQPFFIPSQSMEKTLHGCPGCSGDRILVNKPIYDLRDPHPGDIVVFNAPPGWNDEPPVKPPSNPILRTVRGFGQLVGFIPPDGLVLVKRVIATAGQTVKGDSAGNVYVSKDGPHGTFRKLDEPFVYEDGVDSHAQFGPVTVPKGRLWVMGDHRNDSADSRFHCDGSGSGSNDGADCDAMTSTVPINDVIGKAVIIAWPPSRWRTLGTPSTFKQLALASAAGMPAAGSVVLTVPLWFVRRRRRRSGRRPLGLSGPGG